DRKLLLAVVAVRDEHDVRRRRAVGVLEGLLVEAGFHGVLGCGRCGQGRDQDRGAAQKEDTHRATPGGEKLQLSPAYQTGKRAATGQGKKACAPQMLGVSC